MLTHSPNLFYNGENIALLYDGIFRAVALNLGAGVFGGDNLIANLYGHDDLLAVDHAAGSYGYDLSDLRLFLCGAGQDDAGLGGLFYFNRFYDYAVCQRFYCHGIIPLSISGFFRIFSTRNFQVPNHTYILTHLYAKCNSYFQYSQLFNIYSKIHRKADFLFLSFIKYSTHQRKEEGFSMEILEGINQLLCGILLPLITLLGGLFFTFLLRFAPILHPFRILRVLIHSSREEGGSPVRALTLALAGTLGVGNIIGVSSAILAGGAGAVFWMILSALLVMAVKYAEVVLAVRYRECENRHGRVTFFGGAPYYIKHGMKTVLGRRGAAILGGVFALLCIANSFITGTVVQVNAAVSSVPSLSPVLLGLFFAALTVAAILRGEDRISDITMVLIPLFTLLYVGLSLFILFKNAALVPAVCREILRSAFTPSAAAGGVLGYGINAAMRYGITRGLLSNEAGCGTAPTAHASSAVKEPYVQGLWGIFEVFVDTVLLCTLTALVVLTAFPGGIPAGLSPLNFVVSAYASEVGAAAGVFIRVAIVFFAYATVLCQYFYGIRSLTYLSNKKILRRVYAAVFLLIIMTGAVITSEMMWQISDLIIGILTGINMLCLLSMSKTVSVLSQDLFGTLPRAMPRRSWLKEALRPLGIFSEETDRR